MRILLMGQHFWPEDVSGAVLATQFAESLTKRGHRVTFATCFPNYPKGVVFDGYRGKLFSRDTHHGVTIIRTWSYTAPKEAIKRRFVNYATFSVTAFVAGLVAHPPDIIMSYSPPMPLGLTALLISKLRRTPWILRVEDLFPEYAVKAGVIRNHIVIRTLEWFEKLFYRHAAHISVISDGFRQKLLDRGVPPEKVSVIPVWADPGEVKPMPRDTAFRVEHGWQDKFIVLYSGNLGLTCALEDVIDAAEILQSHEDIHFVIVGEGLRKTELIEAAERKNLHNVVFLPYQPRKRFPEMLATADATLVTLNEDSHSTSLPGKTFNYLASGRPILTVAPLHSELNQIIRRANAGICTEPGEVYELAEAILKLKANERARIEMGHNGRRLLEDHYSLEHCLGKYLQIFERWMQER